ncbi:HalD/BesD family halogenase [Oceanimonas marisflavi]|uniref:HalD/BesD family halogenase n=1 Tax=Oceanimonas marisflavi TaxID=2059724 RepID=UPI000D3021FD|nr:arpA protein [Oceanimonas marisflavi]
MNNLSELCPAHDLGPLRDIIDLQACPIDDPGFRNRCRQTLEQTGALVLTGFMKPAAVELVRQEGLAKQHLAYYTAKQHNVYLSESDPAFAGDHPRNASVTSSKGCITDDIVAQDSPLRTLYNAGVFRDFLGEVLEETLYEYADPLSSINLHYASEGQELGWHFDNSSFATTLLIQKPAGGGVFEYVENLRDADNGDMNYDGVGRVLAGKVTPKQLSMEPGALVLFRGRNALHRVTPTEGDITRMLVVLAYNNQPGVALSENARMTFYGRL